MEGVFIDPEISENLDIIVSQNDIIVSQNETIVSQNDVIVSQMEVLESISEDCRSLNYYQLFTGILIVAVLGIIAGQGFVKIFKR